MSSFTIHLTITGADGAPKVPLTVEPTITSTQLRQSAAEITQIPIDSLKLIFRGRLIVNDDSQLAVSEFKIEEGSVLHCMGKPASASSTSASGISIQMPSSSNTVAPPAAARPTNRLPFNASPSASAYAPVASADPLQDALAILRAGLSPAEYLIAVQTIEKIVSNIVTQPMEEKYRSLKKSNAAFQRKLGGKYGGDEVMRAAGFVVEVRDGTEYYALRASADAWPKLVATHGTLQATLRQTQAISAAPVAPLIPPSMGSSQSMPPFDMIPPDFMSNPAEMQAMLQNPMVQNMIRTDPRLRNNPMVDQLLNNPAILQQVSQAMQDPAMAQRMQHAAAEMARGGLPGGFGSMTPTFNNSAPINRSTANQQQGVSDEETTEEEMIAEAIRRSLQDGN